VTPRPIIYKHARPAYLDVQAFADHFAISKMSAYRLLHTGVVKWVRVGRSMRIPVAELKRYERACEDSAYTDVWGES
jgi:excisionase family DNA binding protein